MYSLTVEYYCLMVRAELMKLIQQNDYRRNEINMNFYMSLK